MRLIWPKIFIIPQIIIGITLILSFFVSISLDIIALFAIIGFVDSIFGIILSSIELHGIKDYLEKSPLRHNLIYNIIFTILMALVFLMAALSSF
ncbi:MAG: hypothetical protein Q7S56_00730 [Nanoarchaeota archaeon]|nr:hypothetical protein [Nanoarchaeota archaeon]